jgi:acetylornithine/N-succinyldiaminopimelate aminotransferase
LAAGKATGTFQAGNHGSTFGGNPLASVAALTTLDILQQEQLLAHAEQLGGWLKQTLRQRLSQVAGVVTVRGQGLMLGIELNRPCGTLVQAGLDKGLLINVTADTVVRLLPPLIFSQTEAQQLVDILCPLITDFLSQNA